MSVLNKNGGSPQYLCTIYFLHLNTRCKKMESSLLQDPIKYKTSAREHYIDKK